MHSLHASLLIYSPAPPPHTPTQPSRLSVGRFSASCFVLFCFVGLCSSSLCFKPLQCFIRLGLEQFASFLALVSSTSWLHVASSTSDSLSHFICLHIFLLSLPKISLRSKSPTLTVTLQASTWLTSRPSIHCQCRKQCANVARRKDWVVEVRLVDGQVACLSFRQSLRGSSHSSNKVLLIPQICSRLKKLQNNSFFLRTPSLEEKTVLVQT